MLENELPKLDVIHVRSQNLAVWIACKQVTYKRRFSKLLILPFKDEAGEVHGDVLLAVHPKCSISKPPYIMSRP